MWQMILHHFVSFILLTWSYCISYYRIGVTLLVLTDLADPFLEFAKVMKYIGFQKVTDYLFILFAVYFLITRVILYPYIIIYPVVEYLDVLPYGIGFVILLGVLQLIFYFWSFLILAIGFNLAMGKGADDTRDEE